MESTIVSLRCPEGNLISTVCSSPKCDFPASCCEQDDCKCSVNHQTCNLLKYKNIYKKITSRILPHEDLDNYISKIYDDIIDQISKIRQNTQQIIKYYGLKSHEIKLMKAIEDNKLNTLKGKDINMVCDSLQNQTFNFSIEKTKQIIQKIWQEVCHVSITPFLQIKDICELPSLQKSKPKKAVGQRQEKRRLSTKNTKSRQEQNSIISPRRRNYLTNKNQSAEKISVASFFDRMLQSSIYKPIFREQIQQPQQNQARQQQQHQNQVDQVKQQRKKKKQVIQVVQVKQAVKPINPNQDQSKEIKNQQTIDKVTQLQQIFGQSQVKVKNFIKFWQLRLDRQLQIQQLSEIFILQSQQNDKQ